MIIILNIVTYVSIAISFCLDRLGKSCAIPGVIGIGSQIVALAFVIYIGITMKQDPEMAALVLEMSSTPKDCIALLQVFL